MLAAVAAVRAATGLPVGVTTGIWTVHGDVVRRLDLVAGWTGVAEDRERRTTDGTAEHGFLQLLCLLEQVDGVKRVGHLDQFLLLLGREDFGQEQPLQGVFAES